MTVMAVVGAGQAGQSLVETLRGEGFDGRIVLVGEEPVGPYQRPPLSKKYLLGEMSAERLAFRPETYFEEHKIETRWGTRVARIDRETQTLHFETGETLDYDRLALTTGSTPRRLPDAIGGALPGVFVVRSLADVDAMAPQVRQGARVAVIGGGYIGLEAAAVAAAKGLHVTVLERAPRILQRVAAPETSAYFDALHTHHGVDIRAGVELARLEAGADGSVARAVLADGEAIEIDFAIVGVGVAPNDGLAAAAGLALDNGIAVDGAGRTSDPAIFAAGDCASFEFRGQRIRLESVQNAIDQAAAAAKSMLGSAVSYKPLPWFWSDQYAVKLQIAGLNLGYDRVLVRQGDGGGPGAPQSIWYYRGDTFLAVDALNEARAFMLGKRWLAAGGSPDPAVIADPGVALKNMPMLTD